jgi:predicted nucleic acid-binding protein
VIVLDTNVVSELMRAAPDANVVGWVRTQVAAAICTTSVTVGEIGYGIARLPAGRRRAVLACAVDDVFSVFADRVLAFDVAAAGHYADVVVEREQAGTPISGFDAQIAAICRLHGAVLATRNTADFDHLGLALCDPWAGAPDSA